MCGDIMSEISLKLEFSIWFEENIVSYLCNLAGVKDVLIDVNKSDIYIKYDESIISTYVLVKEIQLFLSKVNEPFVLGFDKYIDEDVVEEEVYIKRLCCEYCLMGAIEELMYKDCIISVNTDFDFHNKDNVKIIIKYKEEIEEQELNNIKDYLINL